MADTPTDAATERAAIVAWLRELSGYPREILDNYPPNGEVWILHRAADAIEAGEHNKEAGR